MTITDTVSFTGEAPVDALSLPPGAELAGTLESLIPFALGDGELIDALRAFRREASWAQAGQGDAQSRPCRSGIALRILAGSGLFGV
jgi:hypothetical protein